MHRVLIFRGVHIILVDFFVEKAYTDFEIFSDFVYTIVY